MRALARGGHVPLGIDESVSLRVNREIELTGDQDLLSLISAPGLPVLVCETEDGFSAEDRLNIASQRLHQILFDFAEHLVGLGDLDGMTVQAEMLAQLGHNADMDSTDRRRSEINGQTIRFAMGERSGDAFPATHGRTPWRGRRRRWRSRRIRPRRFLWRTAW